NVGRGFCPGGTRLTAPVERSRLFSKSKNEMPSRSSSLWHARPIDQRLRVRSFGRKELRYEKTCATVVRASVTGIPERFRSICGEPGRHGSANFDDRESIHEGRHTFRQGQR